MTESVSSPKNWRSKSFSCEALESCRRISSAVIPEKKAGKDDCELNRRGERDCLHDNEDRGGERAAK